VAPAQTIKPGPTPASHPAPFVHPGLLHTAADLARMKAEVAAGAEPWKSGFAKLADDPESSAAWTPRPFEHVERSLLTGHNIGINEMNKDCNAAYQNALMWCITGDAAHAREAVAILNAWSGKLKVLDGADVELGAGIDGFKFANAAELPPDAPHHLLPPAPRFRPLGLRQLGPRLHEGDDRHRRLLR
jgi:hypothetical protein